MLQRLNATLSQIGEPQLVRRGDDPHTKSRYREAAVSRLVGSGDRPCVTQR